MPYLMNQGDRVDDLVNAAIHLIRTEGIGAFTIRKLASVVRVSPSSLVSHLEHKKRITTLVTHRMGDRLERELWMRVRRGGTAGLVPDDDDLLAVVRTWLAMTELGRADDDLAAAVAVREEALAEVVRDGFRLEHDDVVTSQTLYALMVGLWTAMCARRAPMPPEVARTILRHLCTRMDLTFVSPDLEEDDR